MSPVTFQSLILTLQNFWAERGCLIETPLDLEVGAGGVGWQILLDGMEITQFTYFQQAGGIDLAPISAEITYGLERLTMFLSRKASVFDIEWTDGVAYGPVRHQDEFEFSKYYFEV